MNGAGAALDICPDFRYDAGKGWHTGRHPVHPFFFPRGALDVYTEFGIDPKEGKPDGFHYSEHRTVDSKRNIVVNVRVTPANVNDVDPVPNIIDDIEKNDWGICQAIWA